MSATSVRSCGCPPGLVRVAFILALSVLPAVLAAQSDEQKPLRLGSNENPFGFSPKALAVMQENAASSNYYNRDAVATLIKTAAEWEGAPSAEWIFPTPGSGPVLELTAMAYAGPGKKMITAMPGYPQLAGAWEKFGGTVVRVPVGADMDYDFAAMAAAVDADTALVYICNPNNPTGVLTDPAKLRSFLLRLPPKVLAFVDEAYLELSDSGLKANTMAPLVKLRENMIVSRTFSKAYGLAGARVGYGLANPKVLEKVRFYDTADGPNFLSAMAATEALKDQEHMAYSASMYQKVRNATCAEFDAMGVKYIKPNGAFIMFDTGMDSGEFRDLMRTKYNILVSRPFPPYPDPSYSTWGRVSIGSEADMQAFLAAFKEIRAQNRMASL